MTPEAHPYRFLNTCAAIGVVALVIYIMIVGQDIMQPIVLAVVIWFIISSLANAILGNARRYRLPVPFGLALLIACIIAGLALWLLYVIVENNVGQIIDKAPQYGVRLKQILDEIYVVLNMKPPPGNPLEQLVQSIDLSPLLQDLATTLTGLAGDIGLISVYVVFLFFEQGIFRRKMLVIARRRGRQIEVGSIMTEISEDIRKYVGIKTLTSLLTGGTSYAVLTYAGVDFAEFWAVIIFLLNYIPTVGSILGVVFPVIVAFLQGNDIAMPIAVAAVLTVFQVFIGNWIEPRMMGRRLNLSPFVLIVSLAFWTVIWGVVGAFLCVPIMVIISIILSKFEQTQWIAILLSGTGKVKESETSVRLTATDAARPTDE